MSPVETVYVMYRGKRVPRYRWGKHGKPYAKRSDAEKQGRAIEASKHGTGRKK